MKRPRLRSLAALLLCAAPIAGCGGGSSGSRAGGGSSAGPSPATSAAGVPGSADVKAAVARCRRIVASQPKLPARAKAKLEAACVSAAQGDTAAGEHAAREVCEEVIDAASLPASTRRSSLAACRR